MYSEKITPPSEHSDDQFRYVVHATSPEWVDFSMERVLGELEGSSYLHASYIGSDNDYSQDGASLGHIETFRGAGIIIEPAEAQVKVAWPKDLNTPCQSDSLDYLVENYSEFAKLQPDELLESTPTPTHNHLILEGNPEAEITGVFYRENWAEGIEECAQEMGKEVESVKGDKGIPVVAIPDEVSDDVKRPTLEEISEEFTIRWENHQF
ncbi:MAG: hypothetical protein ABEJ93_02725 [Candidatus Nanohalobium sp.]